MATHLMMLVAPVATDLLAVGDDCLNTMVGFTLTGLFTAFFWEASFRRMVTALLEPDAAGVVLPAMALRDNAVDFWRGRGG